MTWGGARQSGYGSWPHYAVSMFGAADGSSAMMAPAPVDEMVRAEPRCPVMPMSAHSYSRPCACISAARARAICRIPAAGPGDQPPARRPPPHTLPRRALAGLATPQPAPRPLVSQARTTRQRRRDRPGQLAIGCCRTTSKSFATTSADAISVSDPGRRRCAGIRAGTDEFSAGHRSLFKTSPIQRRPHARDNNSR